MNEAIKVEGLMKRYADFALGPLTIAVPAGTVTGLIGANGAGKTTLIKCLLGLTKIDEGNVKLLEQSIPPSGIVPDALKERIGTVLDACAFPRDLRVRDVAQLGHAAFCTWNQRHFDELTYNFAIEDTKRVRDLSRGMGMKLSLAFALAHDPDLLILDEATAGLDPLARDEVLDILRSFMGNDHRAILMSTHITSDLEKLADRIVCIDKGHEIFSVSKDAICDEAGIAHCRQTQVDDLVASDLLQFDLLRIIRGPYGVDVLVSDRFAFARAFPDIPVDRATIDDYVALTLKGEAL